MKNSAILRTAKVGGFNKEDVLTYVDELNAKIDSLKSELETAKSVQTDVSELDNYKNEIERLRERLSETEIKLSEVRTDADSAKAELQNEKNTALDENKALKAEIADLKARLENSASVSTSEVQPAVDVSGYENEISELKQQLSSAKGQIAEMSGEMSKLTADISDKAKKIERLTLDNEDLRLQTDNSGFSSDFDMGALFSEAQATAKKIVVEARMAADKLVRDAKAKADSLVNEANANAEKVNTDAALKAAEIEEDARKDTKSAVDAVRRLRSLFSTEADMLCKKCTTAVENVEAASKRLTDAIEYAKNNLSDNIGGFVEEGSELDKAVKSAESVFQPETVTETKIEEPIYTAYSYSAPAEDDGMPYISMPDVEEVDAENLDDSVLEDVSGEPAENIPSKDSEAEIDDILSSFAIDPIRDDDEEPVVPKQNAGLGFDLGDLAKLAAEAEKDM